MGVKRRRYHGNWPEWKFVGDDEHVIDTENIIHIEDYISPEIDERAKQLLDQARNNLRARRERELRDKAVAAVRRYERERRTVRALTVAAIVLVLALGLTLLCVAANLLATTVSQ